MSLETPLARRLINFSLVTALIVIFTFFFSRESEMQAAYNKKFNSEISQYLIAFSNEFGSPVFATRQEGGNFANTANRRDFTLCAFMNGKLACSQDANHDFIWEGFLVRRDGYTLDISVPRQVRVEHSPDQAAQIMADALYAFSIELSAKQ